MAEDTTSNHADPKFWDGTQTQGSKYEKKRLYVRELSGLKYSLAKELEELRSIPRVTKAKDLKFNKGPQYFNTHILNPSNNKAQCLYAHFAVIAPGGKSQKHGHINEAAFYILDGKGYDIQDGVRHDWEAGDLAIVPNSCVHQHFNADPDRPARAIIIKSKPLYLFMNMLFQEVVELQPKTPSPGHEHFKPSVNEEIE